MHRNQISRYLRPGMFPGIVFEAGDGSGDGTPPPVEFTAEQQTKVQALIDTAVARNSKAWEKKESDWNKRLEALESKGKPGEDDKGKEKAKGGEPTAEKMIPLSEFNRLKSEWESGVNSEKEGLSKQIASLLGEKRKSAIMSAASKLNVVNLDDISKLVDDALGFDDDGAIIVKDKNGNGRIGPKGDYLSVEEYLGEYLKTRPYLVKSSVQSGGGGSNKPGSQPQTDNRNLSPAEKIARGLEKLRGSQEDTYGMD